MDPLKKIVARIEKRMKDPLVDMNATQASREAGLSVGAIYNWQRGAKGKIKVKGMAAESLSKLAPVLRTSAEWLMSGAGQETVDDFGPQTDEPATPMIPVKGYVGAGSIGNYYAISQGHLDQIPAPADSNENTTALEIRGTSLGVFFDRWYVVYDEVRRPVSQDQVGKLCVVGLSDDRVLVKKIKRAKNGRYTLLSQSGEDDIENVDVEWAALVKTMVPG
jgi:hypothetical protein